MVKTESPWGLTTVNSLRGLESTCTRMGETAVGGRFMSRRLGLGSKEYGG